MAIKTPSTKLSSKSTVAACIVICIIMVIILLAAGRSFYTRITHNGRVLNKKQAAENQLKTNISNLPGLSTAYDNLGATQTLVKQSLPDTPDFPSIVATMEVIAGASNVGLTTVSPLASTFVSTTAVPGSAAASDTAPVPYQFSVTVKGPYSGILTFLSNLQLSARPITITGLQFNGTTDALSGTINCQTYSYNPAILQDKTEVVK